MKYHKCEKKSTCLRKLIEFIGNACILTWDIEWTVNDLIA